jgi:hypothetical protein
MELIEVHDGTFVRWRIPLTGGSELERDLVPVLESENEQAIYDVDDHLLGVECSAEQVHGIASTSVVPSSSTTSSASRSRSSV